MIHLSFMWLTHLATNWCFPKEGAQLRLLWYRTEARFVFKHYKTCKGRAFGNSICETVWPWIKKKKMHCERDQLYLIPSVDDCNFFCLKFVWSQQNFSKKLFILNILLHVCSYNVCQDKCTVTGNEQLFLQR